MSEHSSSKIKTISPLLLVKDIEESIEFYTKNLGFELSFRYENFYAGIVKDGCSIHLKISGEITIAKKQSIKSKDDLDFIFSVEGIESMYKNIIDKPVIITQQLRQMPYGKEFYIADADGYIIGFIEA